MTWPLSQDYNEAIQNPASSFADGELRGGQVVVNALGVPLPRSGNFADVYEFEGASGARWAVKCFTREIPGLQYRYGEISKFLGRAKLPFTVDFQYLEQGIRVRGRWFPVLKMHWVAGFLLNEFVRKYIEKPHLLDKLVIIWLKMGKRLNDAGMAHADLQHGNIILVPGKKTGALAVKLIDYDGMFVPALANKKSAEVGHPSYQHPQRLQQGIYTADVDRLPLLAIACGLRCLTVAGRKMWERYDNGDNLLFREADLRAPAESALLREIWNLPDDAAHDLAGHLTLGLLGTLDRVPLLHDLVDDRHQVRPLTPAQEAQVTSVLGVGFRAAHAGRPTAAPARAAQLGLLVDDSSPWEDLQPSVTFAAKKRRTASMVPWAISAAVLALFMTAGMVFVLFDKRAEKAKASSDVTLLHPVAGEPAVDIPEAKHASKPSNDASTGLRDANVAVNTPSKKPQPALKDAVSAAPPQDKTDTPVAKPTKTPPVPTKQIPIVLFRPQSGSINLLQHLDIENQTGAWRLDGEILESDARDFSPLGLTYGPVPHEYELRITAERTKGTDGLYLGLYGRGSSFSIVLGRGRGDSFVDFQNAKPAAYKPGPLFKKNEAIDIVIKVETKGFSVAVANKIIIKLPGSYRDFGLSNKWSAAVRNPVFLGSNKTVFRITKLELIPLGKKAEEVLVAVPAPSSTAAAPSKQPIPPPDILKSMAARVRSEHAAALASNDENGKLELIRRLFSDAAKASSPEQRYSCLRLACTVAADIPAFSLVFEAVARLEREFDVKRRELLVETLEHATEAGKEPERLMLLTPAARRIVEEIRNTDDFELTPRLHKLSALAGVLKNPLRHVDDCRKELAKIRTMTKGKPGALTLGKYVCFFKEDWPHGLPLLEEGSDALAKLARRDLDDPRDPKAQVELGEGWWKLAVGYADNAHEAIQRRARHWFYQALPTLPPPERRKICARYLKRKPDGRQPGLHGFYFADDKLVKDRTDLPLAGKLPAEKMYSEWHGWLRAPEPGFYRVRVAASDRCRVYLAGAWILDTGPKEDSKGCIQYLTADPQELRVTFEGKSENPALALSWKRLDEPVERPIPLEAFFHVPPRKR